MEGMSAAPPVASAWAIGRIDWRGTLAPAGVGLLLLLVGANSGGYYPTTWGWTGVALAWVAALALLLSSPRLGRLELATVAALTAYVAWAALTRIWSDAPGHTLVEVQRDLIYPLALASALLLVRRSAVTMLVGAVATALAAIALYGLLTRLFPERLGAFDSVAGYRLAAPVGYWNTLGIVTAVAIVLAFGFAARGPLAVRALAGAALVGLAPTLYFTFSRGAVIALVLGMVALLLVDTRRLQLSVAALVVLPLPAVATSVASRYDALTTTAAPLAAASHDGHRLAWILATMAVVSGALALALGVAERLVASPVWLRRVYAVAVSALAAALAVAVLAHFGGPVHMVNRAYDSFRGPPVGSTAAGSNLSSRFSSLSSNGRLPLWQAAWDDFRRRPVVGSGAGSFEWYWAANQPVTGGKARDAHSLYVETLAEMGVVGLALIVAALLMPFGAVLTARRHPVIPFAVAAYVALVAHIGVDWDWEMPVVILSGLFCAAAILIAGRREQTAAEIPVPVWLGALVIVVAAGVFAFAGFMSSNALAAAKQADSDGKYASALHDARKAADWAPWSAEPWKQLAEEQQALSQAAAARASLRKATELEPLDYDAWLQLGHASKGGAQRRAFAEARRLYPLNPLNPAPPGPRP